MGTEQSKPIDRRKRCVEYHVVRTSPDLLQLPVYLNNPIYLAVIDKWHQDVRI
jgi:hypothetical protein